MNEIQLLEQVIDRIEDMDRPTVQRIIDLLEALREEKLTDMDRFMEEEYIDEDIDVTQFVK